MHTQVLGMDPTNDAAYANYAINTSYPHIEIYKSINIYIHTHRC
jgi:hypothetical protein